VQPLLGTANGPPRSTWSNHQKRSNKVSIRLFFLLQLLWAYLPNTGPAKPGKFASEAEKGYFLESELFNGFLYSPYLLARRREPAKIDLDDEESGDDEEKESFRTRRRLATSNDETSEASEASKKSDDSGDDDLTGLNDSSLRKQISSEVKLLASHLCLPSHFCSASSVHSGGAKMSTKTRLIQMTVVVSLKM
jgi:hypothetical protein